MIYTLAAKIEQFALKSIRLHNRYPPTFIIGLPRSGTTVLYQHLHNSFKWAYFPNISNQYRNAPLTAALWGRFRYTHQPTYNSNYGIINGPMAPGDGWDIFHRWFPRYQLDQPVDTPNLFQLKNLVRLMETLFRAPFINKNNNNCTRIHYLNQLFPDSLFVCIERDVQDTVFSILEGRATNRVKPGNWWGTAPPRFYNHTFDSEIQQVVYQVLDGNNHIGESLQTIPENRKIQLTYNQFCNTPDQVIQWITEAYARHGVKLKKPKKTKNQIDTHLDTRREIKIKPKKHPPHRVEQINRIIDEFKSMNSNR